MDILRQLGHLFLDAIPTVIVVFLFYLFLRWAFFGPIEKAMSERHARIEGARAEAIAAQQAARKESDAYNEALKKARAEIYAEHEAERQMVLDERARLLKAMRSRAVEDVSAAKKEIAAAVAAARAQLERQTPELAGEMVRKILENREPLRGGSGR